jgi:hypothetical protein
MQIIEWRELRGLVRIYPGLSRNLPLNPTPVSTPAGLPVALLWTRMRHRARQAVGVAALLVLAGCNSVPPVQQYGPQENFGSVATYSRLFDATPAHTCEAARRALLSQGYLINSASAEQVEGKKNFQPDAESHLQILIRVVCVPDSADGQISLGFVTAVQDRYTVKKANNSASLGVGAIGSVSLPFMAGSEAMVKIGSETIAAGRFYDSFFDLVRRYLSASDLAVE